MKEISMNEMQKVTGGENANIAKYSEEELAKIFELYFEMYGEAGALPYISDWGVTTGDYYLMARDKYWTDTPYCGAPRAWKLAHLVYKRNH